MALKKEVDELVRLIGNLDVLAQNIYTRMEILQRALSQIEDVQDGCREAEEEITKWL